MRRRDDHGFRGGITLAGKKPGPVLVEHDNHLGFYRDRAENANEPRNTRFVEYPVNGRGPAVFRR
jgi:hypothetical protein